MAIESATSDVESTHSARIPGAMKSMRCVVGRRRDVGQREEDQQQDRNADGQQQRLASAHVHAHLGAGLGPPRPHGRGPLRSSAISSR